MALDYISVNWVPALQMYNKTKDLQKTVDLPVYTFIPSERISKSLDAAWKLLSVGLL